MSPRRYSPEEFEDPEAGPLFTKRPPDSEVIAAMDRFFDALEFDPVVGGPDPVAVSAALAYLKASEPAPPHKGVPTSVAASESMKGRAPTDRKRVLDLITWTGGATSDEIEVALDLRHQNASARVWELAGGGGHPARIRDSGETRKTRSGRMAIVWKLS